MQVCAPAKEIKRIALVWNKIYKGQCLAARAAREILASLGLGEPSLLGALHLGLSRLTLSSSMEKMGIGRVCMAECSV
jgi:hypothetical protein